MSCDETLKARGLKLTPQRKLILDIIHHADEHLTGEKIVSQVQSRMPGVNKSTIYRTLDLLVHLRCVIKSEMDDKSIYHHADEGHHHHLVCRSCGKTVACQEEFFLPLQKQLEDQYGFQIDFRHVVLNGVCNICRS